MAVYLGKEVMLSSSWPLLFVALGFLSGLCTLGEYFLLSPSLSAENGVKVNIYYIQGFGGDTQSS